MNNVFRHFSAVQQQIFGQSILNSLHHILNIELLFSKIYSSLYLSNDQIDISIFLIRHAKLSHEKKNGYI